METVRRRSSARTFRAGNVRRILISHGHVNHIGGLPELLRHMRAEVAVHPLNREAIVTPREHTVVGVSRLNAFLQRAGVDTAAV